MSEFPEAACTVGSRQLPAVRALWTYQGVRRSFAHNKRHPDGRQRARGFFRERAGRRDLVFRTTKNQSLRFLRQIEQQHFAAICVSADFELRFLRHRSSISGLQLLAIDAYRSARYLDPRIAPVAQFMLH